MSRINIHSTSVAVVAGALLASFAEVAALVFGKEAKYVLLAVTLSLLVLLLIGSYFLNRYSAKGLRELRRARQLLRQREKDRGHLEPGIPSSCSREVNQTGHDSR